MSDKMKHTPVPWRIGDAGTTVFGPPNGNLSPVIVAPGLTRANARLIAQAVNNHAALLTALQDLFEHCAMVHKHWGDNCNQKEADAAIQSAKAAIAKATPNTEP